MVCVTLVIQHRQESHIMVMYGVRKAASRALISLLVGALKT